MVSVVEVSGTKMSVPRRDCYRQYRQVELLFSLARLRGKGKMMDNNGHGTLWIRGSFQSKRDKFFKVNE